MRILALIAIAACGSSNPSGTVPDGSAGSGSGSSGTNPDAAVIDSATPVIPAPTGTCPTLAPGDVTFAPAGIPPRKVKLAFDPAKVGHGELVFYWYATGSGTAEAAYSLGATLNAITAAGGIVATPYADSTAGQFEWFIVNGSAKQDDFLVADEVVGCFAQAHLIDTNQIHSMGMSAGALQTTALSFIRASYVASVATYSVASRPGSRPRIRIPRTSSPR